MSSQKNRQFSSRYLIRGGLVLKNESATPCLLALRSVLSCLLKFSGHQEMIIEHISFLLAHAIGVSITCTFLFWVAWFFVHHWRHWRAAIRPFVRLHWLTCWNVVVAERGYMFGGAVHYIIYAQGWSLAFSCDVGMSLQRTEETFVA